LDKSCPQTVVNNYFGCCHCCPPAPPAGGTLTLIERNGKVSDIRADFTNSTSPGVDSHTVQFLQNGVNVGGAFSVPVVAGQTTSSCLLSQAFPAEILAPGDKIDAVGVAFNSTTQQHSLPFNFPQITVPVVPPVAPDPPSAGTLTFVP
jgi:hypothetical protein